MLYFVTRHCNANLSDSPKF